jgi:hypothetical protein
MKQSKSFWCWWLMAFLGGIVNGSAASDNFTFFNAPGKDGVGFRIVLQYDYSRSYQAKTDVMGKPTQGERARPIQTLIWYPAQDSAAKQVSFGGYLELFTTQENFKQTPEVAGAILAPACRLKWDDYRCL